MGLFDELAGKIGGAGTSQGGQGLMASVLALLNSQPGGIAGLLQTFQQKGLGNIASSWIGTGANLPISAEQVQQVFGGEQIRNFAAQAGVSGETASAKLADLLPGVVDRLTPDGQVPQGDLLSKGAELLKGFAGGKLGL